jgi:C4-dicarboxylate transporter DctM subunit
MGVSVTRQFAAGFGPGIVMGVIFMIYSFWVSKKRGWRGERRESWKQILKTFLNGFWALMLPLIVLGGIYSGIMTPTEAAAVSVGYALFVDILIYKELKLPELPKILAESAVFSGSLMFILACAMAFSWYLTSEQIPNKISTFLVEFVGHPWVFLLMVNIIFLILGCFIDIISAMLIVCPLLIPILGDLKIDLYHFGIIAVFNMEIGFMTPPFGVNLFVSSGMTKLPLLTVTRSVIPFFILMLFALILITYIPGISLFIPDFFSIK